jgi:hypothetical protein
MRKPLLAFAAFALAATAWPAQRVPASHVSVLGRRSGAVALQPAPPVASRTRQASVGSGYSVDLPVVTKIQGATKYYTSIDITNNTSVATDVSFEYAPYDGSAPVDGVFQDQLLGLDSFHFDDFVQYLVDQGLLDSTRGDNTFGTLLVTFDTGSVGNEFSVTARVYNYVSAGQLPSYGLSYRGEPLRIPGATTLTALIRDTTLPSATGPVVVTNLGIENQGLTDNGDVPPGNITVTLKFYDPRTGQQVGSEPQLTLFPGQVIQLNDVFGRNSGNPYDLPADATDLIVFAEGPTGPDAPHIQGYVVLKDTYTNDGSFYFMQEANGL